jgi:hypothetical protein
MRRRVILVAALTALIAVSPRMASAGSLFDVFFGGGQKQPQKAAPQGNFFADLFGFNQQPAPPPRAVASGGGAAFCVRSCDGRYFPLTARGSASPVQLCQAFCPASTTKVFFGGTIEGASSASGERYADSENAYGFRKALRADCTCNGRDPAGLAPVDLTLDTSLRPGDVIATTDGLVAYSGVRGGVSQSSEFTPVASYPGLTADVRARLGEMKVAPPVSEQLASETPPPAAALPKTLGTRAKRAELD